MEGDLWPCDAGGDRLYPDCDVEVHSITEDSVNCLFNGYEGQCAEYDDMVERVLVNIKGQIMEFSPTNLRLVKTEDDAFTKTLRGGLLYPGAIVCIRGLRGKGIRLNGKQGVCEHWDKEKQLMDVRLPNEGETHAISNRSLRKVKLDEQHLALSSDRRRKVLEFCHQYALSSHRRGKVLKMFHQYDHDRTCTLDSVEFGNLLEEVGLGALRESFLEATDKKCDSRICCEEFLDWAMAQIGVSSKRDSIQLPRLVKTRFAEQPNAAASNGFKFVADKVMGKKKSLPRSTNGEAIYPGAVVCPRGLRGKRIRFNGKQGICERWDTERQLMDVRFLNECETQAISNKHLRKVNLDEQDDAVSSDRRRRVLEFCHQSAVSHDRRSQVLDIFHKYDHDGNSTLDAGEFEKMLKSLGLKHMGDTFFEAIDTDHNNQISCEEFLDWALSPVGLLSRRKKASIFFHRGLLENSQGDADEDCEDDEDDEVRELEDSDEDQVPEILVPSHGANLIWGDFPAVYTVQALDGVNIYEEVGHAWLFKDMHEQKVKPAGKALCGERLHVLEVRSCNFSGACFGKMSWCGKPGSNYWLDMGFSVKDGTSRNPEFTLAKRVKPHKARATLSLPPIGVRTIAKPPSYAPSYAPTPQRADVSRLPAMSNYQTSRVLNGNVSFASVRQSKRAAHLGFTTSRGFEQSKKLAGFGLTSSKGFKQSKKPAGFGLTSSKGFPMEGPKQKSEEPFEFAGIWRTSIGALQDVPTRGFQVTGKRTCEFTVDGELFKGTVEVDGMIHWNDGDIWTKALHMNKKLGQFKKQARLGVTSAGFFPIKESSPETDPAIATRRYLL